MIAKMEGGLYLLLTHTLLSPASHTISTSLTFGPFFNRNTCLLVVWCGVQLSLVGMGWHGRERASPKTHQE